MFFRKNHLQPDNPTLESPPSSPLPRLHQLTILEQQLISILGRRNVAVDDSADIFTRLEEIYLSSLQASPLGLETLEKCLRVVGACDSPARVRFLYLCAHEMILKGAAADQLEPVLLQAFHSSLALRSKVDLGFKAGLAFCQVSEHSAEVDRILSNLIVALEQELGYRPQRKQKQLHHSTSTTNTISHHEATKAIYLGNSMTHKSTHNKTHPHGRSQKLELFTLLFEGFVTGSWRVQSQAKRKYYADCREQLRGRLIREYPGRDIQKRLAKIDQRRSVALGELSAVIQWATQFPQPIGQSSPNRQAQPQLTQTRPNSHSRSTHKQPIRSKSQAASNSMGFQPLKASIHKEQYGSTWNTPTATPSRRPSFKLHIRRSSKLKLESRDPSERVIEGREKEGQSIRPEVTPLVFRASSENTCVASSQGNEKEKGADKGIEKVSQKGKGCAEAAKGIVLKFQRLHHEKAQMKKKKLRNTFNWDKQKPQKQNQLQHVIDLQFLPQIPQERPIPNKSPPDPRPHQSPPDPRPHQSPLVSPDRSFTHPSASDFNSARLIDQLLKEGVEWIAHQESEPSHQAISNAVLSECEMLQPRQEQSYSDTKLVSQSILEEEELSKEASYMIVIKPLEKPEVNAIIGEEVEQYLNQLGAAVILKEAEREQQRMENRRESGLKSKVIRPNRPSKLNPSSRCEASIQIKYQPHVDSECGFVEVADRLAMIKTQVEVVNDLVSEKEQEVMEDDRDASAQAMRFVEEMEEAVCSDILMEQRIIPEITMILVQQEVEGLQEVVDEWLAGLKSAIAEQFAQQYQSKPLIAPQEHINILFQQQPSSQSSKRSLPALPLSRLKCSIKPEQHSLSSQSCSIDDKELSSQIKSSPSIDHNYLLPHPAPFENTTTHIGHDIDLQPRMQLQAPYGEERQGSQFTCSRFLGSKIEMEKESDCEWRSQMNFMNQFFKTDRITEDQPLPLQIPLLQIPESHYDTHLHSEQPQVSQNERNSYRSRTQSQISNKSSKNMRESALSSREMQRGKANACLSLSYSDNYQAVTHTSRRFNHWLRPELKVDNNQLILLMDRVQVKREIVVPRFVVVNDDTIREVSAKVDAFLDRFAQQKQLDEEEVAQIGKQLETVDLLPDEVELPSLTITNNDGQEDDLKCVANLKSLRIVLESTKLFLKVNSIVLHSLSELQSAVSSLSPSKFLIRGAEILPQGYWTFTGQRNIKLREKSQSAVSHLIFDVLERYSEKDDFDYCVREQSGESLSFEGVAAARRGKIIKNMDTIIGFCLKTVEGKARLNGNNVKQFLTLL